MSLILRFFEAADLVLVRASVTHHRSLGKRKRVGQGVQSIVLLGELFKTQIVSEVFVRFSNSLDSYPKASGLGTHPPPHAPTS